VDPMLKKTIALFLMVAFFTFNLNNQVEASFPTDTFQVDFTAVPQTFGTPIYYEFVSDCIEIPFDVNVLSIQSLADPNNLLKISYLSPTELLVSKVDYFVNNNCTTNNNFSQSPSDFLFQNNNNIGLITDKPFVFNIGNIGNFYNINSFTPVRSKSLQVRFASNLVLQDLINFSNAGAPFEDGIAVGTFFSFATPNTIKYNDGFNITTRFFIGTLPASPTPTRTGYTFQYWRDINGNRQLGQTAVNDLSLIDSNGVYNVYSFYTRNVPSGNPIIPGSLGGVYVPLDTILFNTGFLNNGGLLLLYFILAVSIAIMVFKFKLNSLIAIVSNILLTSIFLILGYLPIYTSVLLIAFYIIAIISINKGGFLNE